MSRLSTAVYTARKEILAGQAAIHTRITNHYVQQYERLIFELDSVIKQAISLKEAGESITNSLLYRRTRLESLLLQVEEEINAFAYYAETEAQVGAEEAVRIGSEHFRSLIVNARDVPGRIIPESFMRINPINVQEFIARTSQGSPVRSLFTKLAGDTQTVKKVEEAFVKGFVSGKNPKVIAAAIKDDLQIPLSRAQTIARTEMLGTYRQTTLEGYKANSHVVKGWRWLAARNQRTCAMCLAMDGRKFRLNTPLGTHPNCRCTMIPITLSPKDMGMVGDEGEDLEDSRPTIQTGEEWFSKQKKEVKLAILGKSKLEMMEAGDLNLSDVVGYRVSKKWGPTRWERSIKQIKAGEGKPKKGSLGVDIK